MKVAALDLGSNTFLCLICEVKNQQIVQIYADEVQVVRLGQGLEKTKKFHSEALERAKKTLSHFKNEIIDKHHPEKVLAMATSAARDAENKAELFKICEDLQIPLEIIPGAEEARITYEGAVSGTSQNISRCVIDIGGGSTEFIYGNGPVLLRGQSFDIGCVRLTERFISQMPADLNEISAMTAEIKNFIQQLPAFQAAELLAVAGTPTTLAAAELGCFDVQQIDGYEMSLETLQEWKRKISSSTVQQVIEYGIPPGRADVILSGVIILIEALKKFNLPSIKISTRGVRYGVAMELARR